MSIWHSIARLLTVAVMILTMTAPAMAAKKEGSDHEMQLTDKQAQKILRLQITNPPEEGKVYRYRGEKVSEPAGVMGDLLKRDVAGTVDGRFSYIKCLQIKAQLKMLMGKVELTKKYVSEQQAILDDCPKVDEPPTSVPCYEATVLLLYWKEEEAKAKQEHAQLRQIAIEAQCIDKYWGVTHM
jgi:hypothetical protein